MYSIHSSHSELLEFVDLVAPRALVPITECSAETLHFFEPLLYKSKSNIPNIPDSIVRKMNFSTISPFVDTSTKSLENSSKSILESDSSESQNSLRSSGETKRAGKRSIESTSILLEDIEDSSDDEYEEMLSFKVKQGHRLPLQTQAPKVVQQEEEKVAQFDMTRKKQRTSEKDDMQEFHFSLECKSDESISEKEETQGTTETKQLACNEQLSNSFSLNSSSTQTDGFT